jgi:hypothetical protein
MSVIDWFLEDLNKSSISSVVLLTLQKVQNCTDASVEYSKKYQHSEGNFIHWRREEGFRMRSA